jgi:hypothetical protein
MLFVIMSFASATEPTEQTKVQAARAAYKTELIVQRDGGAVADAHAKCVAAKANYRSAEVDLTRLTSELTATEGAPLGQVQTSYRAKLVEEQRRLEAVLVSAKRDATSAGQALEKAQADLATVKAEIKRIEDEEYYEAHAGERVQTRVIGGLGTHGLGSGISGYGIGGLGGGGLGGSWTVPVPERPTPPLPAEFKACFPDEVETSS